MQYSQHGEDIIISNYFEERKGTFLDLGANDGRTLSNTYLLYEKGWSGVMVEGSPHVFKRLENNFKGVERIQCLNICLSDKEGLVDFYHNTNHHVNPNIDKDNIDLLSTVVANSYERTKNWGFFDKQKIYCYTFDKVIEMSMLNKFTLISIDIEGMDYNILSQINLEKTETECVIIEYNDDIKERNKILSYCSTFNLSNILLDNKTNIILTKN
jgi:FkbM family methyltransferase